MGPRVTKLAPSSDASSELIHGMNLMHQSAGSFLPFVCLRCGIYRMMTQLNAVQSRSQSDIHTVIHEDLAPGSLRQFKSSAREVPTVVEWRGLFPNLYQVDRSVDGVLYLQENREGTTLTIRDVVGQQAFHFWLSRDTASLKCSASQNPKPMSTMPKPVMAPRK